MDAITQAFASLYEVSKLEHYPFRILKRHDSIDESIVGASILPKGAAEKPFCLVRITLPTNSIDHPNVLEETAEQARGTEVDNFILWNLRDTALWQTPPKGTPVSREFRLKTYFTIHEVTTDKNAPLDAKEYFKLVDGKWVNTLTGHRTYEDANFRICVVRQSELLKEVEQSGKTVKWGVYLRAPEVYFEMLEACRDRFTVLNNIAKPLRGSTTRINAFFYLDNATIAKWDIDEEFLAPLIKSPKDTSYIRVDVETLKLKVFVCRKSKAELKKENQHGAMAYIEWGEQQEYTSGVQKGMKWPDGPWVKNRTDSISIQRIGTARSR